MDKFTLQNKALIVIAKRNSGKSILIKYLVQDAIKHNEFNKIFVISSTNSINFFYNDIIPANCIFDKYSEDWVNKLIDLMSEKNKGRTIQSDGVYNVLLILDDMASDVLFHTSNSIKKLYSRGRHSFISIICVGQMLHHVSPLMRNNSDWVITGQLNASNIDLLCDEYRVPIIEKREFIKLYKKSTTAYNFFVINNNSVLTDDDKINSYYGTIKAKI